MGNIDPSLLDRYFENQCTPEEVEIVLTWLGTPEGQAYYANVVEERWKNMEEDTSVTPEMPIDDAKILRSIYQTSERMEQRSHTRTAQLHNRKINFGYRIAAAFLGLLILSSAYYYLSQPSPMVHTTAFGETRKIDLPDGSSVMLNANSQLSYDADWQNERKVWLEGEAFFSVTHQPASQKFVVHAQDLDVEVVGTEFNVNDRRGKTQVVLNTGKVKLTMADTKAGEIFMNPGELVTYSQKDKRVTKEIVDAARYTSWRNNLLIFDDTPVREIVRLIEDNYGLEVQVLDEKILDMHFNAEVPAQDVNILLTLLEKSFDITITKNNNKIIMQHPPKRDAH